jgi:hypothetical protein
MALCSFVGSRRQKEGEMIVWGSGGDSLHLGVVENRQCETCEKERPFILLLNYRYFGFYWLLNWVTHKEYVLVCEVCSRGWALDTKTVESSLQKVPIPFRHRYSGLLGLGLIAAFMFLSAVLGSLVP